MTAVYEKKDGVLRPTKDFQKRFLRTAYKELLVGPPPPKDVSNWILSHDWESDDKTTRMVYYPYEQGAMKAAALIMMKLKIHSFRVIHSHYLVEVFVSSDDADEQSLYQMFSPFFLILHGFIPTPNRRLLDLIQEFIEYKTVEGVPCLFFTKSRPEDVLRNYFNMKGFKYHEAFGDKKGAIL